MTMPTDATRSRRCSSARAASACARSRPASRRRSCSTRAARWPPAPTEARSTAPTRAVPPTLTNPQFLIFSTALNGDPVNCNAPGTYDDPEHRPPGDPSMAPTPIDFGGADRERGADLVDAAGGGAGAHVLLSSRHVHRDPPRRGQGAAHDGCGRRRRDAAVVALARARAGARDGARAADLARRQRDRGRLLPGRAAGVAHADDAVERALGTEQRPRQRGSGQAARPGAGRVCNGVRAQPGARPRRRTSSISYATSTTQLRTLQQGLLASLATIKNNSADSQIQAAIILFQMKVTPVVVVHVGFGGDNHGDPGLAGEIAGHQSGVATLAKMMQALATAANCRTRSRSR